MSNIPDFKRMLREDFKDVPGEWIDKLIYPINSFSEQVTSAMNRNLTIGENVTGMIYTTSFSTPSTYIKNKSFNQINMPWNFRVAPRSVTIGQLINQDNDAPITNPVSLDWRQTGPNAITIRFMAGLKNNTKYTVTFLIL